MPCEGTCGAGGWGRGWKGARAGGGAGAGAPGTRGGGERGLPRPLGARPPPDSPSEVHLPRRPLLHGAAAAARPLLSTTPVPEAAAPPPRLSNLKLPGKRRRNRGMRRPLPRPAGPPANLGPAPPLGHARSALRTPLLNPRPQRLLLDPTSRGIWDPAPHPRPRFPPCTALTPAPQQKGREGHLPGLGFSG